MLAWLSLKEVAAWRTEWQKAKAAHLGLFESCSSKLLLRSESLNEFIER